MEKKSFDAIILICFNNFCVFFQEYTLTDLKTYTQYLVSLRVYNPEGDGPETIVVVMTDEGGKTMNHYFT